MTQKDKDLLLKDLCARLPYGVKCFNGYDENKPLELVGLPTRDAVRIASQDEPLPPLLGITDLERTLMYLRPLSSMTKEEKEKLKEEHKKDEKVYAEVLERIANGDESARGTAIPHFAADWCNAHHFDYRGLIPMGLALEAPEGMYYE